MSAMSPDLASSSETCSPAPYGKACVACSRAKHKCFYRAGGIQCERCHRLGKACEPSRTVRKRKARTPPPPQPPPSTRLEEKLDDLVSLLRSQAVNKQPLTLQQTPQTTPGGNSSTPSTTNAAATSHDESLLSPSASDRYPDVAIDSATSIVQFVRPSSPRMYLSFVLHDIAEHEIPDSIAEECLNTFRQAFIPAFPCLHIAPTTSASEVRLRSPFLWLVIMALSTKSVTQQFELEETIWNIISQRIVKQHMVDMDLLLGLICFAAWSHYFKTEIPFMSMLTQLAVSVAFELGIHNDAPRTTTQRSKFGRGLANPPPRQQPRTMEERRTILALFHVTSSSWIAYRKTEPLRWTPYMDGCLRILHEGTDTYLDSVLAAQVRCQIIRNQVTCSTADNAGEGESLIAPSASMATALLKQLTDLSKSLPANVAQGRITQFYLSSTELTIRATALSRLRTQDETALSQFRRIEELDLILASLERWMTVFQSMPLADWVGVGCDLFAQFTHSMVVLFRLSTLEEPDWDVAQVTKRLDVFLVLDQAGETINAVAEAAGIVDANGSRRGLFFKTPLLIRGIKALFLAEMGTKNLPGGLQSPDSGVNYNPAAEFAGEMPNPDDFLLELSEEPWFTDFMGPSWDLEQESSMYTPFTM